MLAFIYRDGSFIAEKTGPYATRNIITNVGGVMVHPGDTVILIAQNEGEVYGFYPSTEPSEETASLTRGWNLIAMTENQFSMLSSDPAKYKSANCSNLFCDASTIWFLTDEEKCKI